MDLASIGGGNQTVPIRLNEHKTKKRKSHKPDDTSHSFTDTSNAKWYSHRSKTQSSSSDDSDYIRRGQSLDRSLSKQNKNTLCFKRDREAKTPEVRRDSMRYVAKDNTEKYFQDTMTSYSSYETGSVSRSSRSRNRHSEPLPLRRPSDLPVQLTDYNNADVADKQSKETAGRFQIGKRLLKGEIGIKSFNYYLLKEGLKSSKKNASQAKPQDDQKVQFTGTFGKGQGLSKSEENIYEEIYFVDRRYGRKAPAGLQHQQHHQQQQQSARTLYPDCELCNLECTNKNCDICLRTANGVGDVGRSSSRVIGNSYMARHGGGGGVGVSRNQSTGILPPYAASGPGMLMSSSGFSENQSKATKDAAAAAAAAAEHSRQQHVLQYQSYNPNNPGVFKIETTPVAFTSDYNPIHHSIPNHAPSDHHPPQLQHHYATHQSEPPLLTNSTSQFAKQPHKQQHNIHPTSVLAHSNSRYETTNTRTKSSSSSDSMHHNKFAKQPQSLGSRNNQSEFQSEYQLQTQPQPRHHPPQDVQPNHHHNSPQYHQHHQAYPPPIAAIASTNHFDITTGSAKIYKTDSRSSIMSENMSVKSENSGNYRQGFYRRTLPPGGAAAADMSDSSIGDSLFSYSAQRRYFGSAESCRFGYDCRRCSYDGDKCSFSDNCRYECRNCDCSSSYFSSDFDDGANHHQFSRQNSAARMSASMPPNQNKGSTSSSQGCRNAPYNNPNHQRHNTSPATGSLSDTMDLKTTRYAEDFIKHITNVKQNVIYQTGQPPSSESNLPIKRPLNINPITSAAGGDIISLPRKTYFGTTTAASLPSNPQIVSSSSSRPNLCPDYATVTSKKAVAQKPTSDTSNKLEERFANRNNADDTANADAKTKSLPSVKKSAMATEYAQVRKVTKTTTGAIPKAITNPQLSTIPQQTARGGNGGIRNSPKKSLRQCAGRTNTTPGQMEQQQRLNAISTPKSKSSPIRHKQQRSANTKSATTKESSSPPSTTQPTPRDNQSTDLPPPLHPPAPSTQLTKERLKIPFNPRKALPALPVLPPSSQQSDNRVLPTAMPRTMFDKYPTKGDGRQTSKAITVADKLAQSEKNGGHATASAHGNHLQQQQQFMAAAGAAAALIPPASMTSATITAQSSGSIVNTVKYNKTTNRHVEDDEVRTVQTAEDDKHNNTPEGGYDAEDGDDNNDDDDDDDDDGENGDDDDDVFVRQDPSSIGGETRTRRRRKKIKVSRWSYNMMF